MEQQTSELTYRPFKKEDVVSLPVRWQGSREEILDRISKIGSSAMLVFEGRQHVGQLQFRPYIPQTRSPNGVFDPLYWMDFQGRTPVLPDKTLALFCYHVGQLDNTATRHAGYFGRGIGIRLLEKTVNWAATSGFKAIVAKGLPNVRPVMEFMGGLPTETYQQNGFKAVDSYVDDQLRTELEKMMKEPSRESLRETLKDADLDDASTICICVKDL